MNHEQYTQFLFYFKLVVAVYIIFFSLNVLATRLKPWQKAMWILVIIVLPLFGAYIFHTYHNARLSSKQERRRFSPDFRGKKNSTR